MGEGRPKTKPRREPGERDAPPELRASTFALGGETILVLSYPAAAVSSEAGPLAPLTASEAEVLRAALGGLSNAEIARMRGRSVSTVENQLASAYRKLGVTTRAEAATLLERARR